jgi:hypothetical protein
LTARMSLYVLNVARQIMFLGCVRTVFGMSNSESKQVVVWVPSSMLCLLLYHLHAELQAVPCVCTAAIGALQHQGPADDHSHR